jgi:hypothetical protein
MNKQAIIPHSELDQHTSGYWGKRGVETRRPPKKNLG